MKLNLVDMRRRHAYSVTEYFVIIMIITGALFVFKDYLIRGISGKWKGAGDNFGFGRQYDPNKTEECLYDQDYTNSWYHAICVENHNCPPGNKGCEEAAIKSCQANASYGFCNQ